MAHTFFDFKRTEKVRYEKLNSVDLIKEGKNGLGSLYLGNLQFAKSLEGLQSKNICAVVSLLGALNTVNFPPEITHKYVHIEDSEDQEIRSTFEECIVFIRDNLKHGSVLVHCAAGVSRSATIIIAYMMQDQNMTYKEAYNYVQHCRAQVYPNHGFRLQLQEFDIELSIERQMKFEANKKI